MNDASVVPSDDARPVSVPGVDTSAVANAPRRRAWHRVWQGLTLLLVVLAGLYIYQYATKGRFWRGTFERYASERAGRPVRVAGDFQLYLAPGIRFRAEGLSVANPAWAKQRQFFAARSIAADAPLLKAIFGAPTIDDLVIDGGRLALQRRADKANTWTFGGGPLDMPDILRAAITDSHITLIDAPTRTRLALVFGAIAGSARDGQQRMAGPLGFTGTGTAGGAPFSLDGRLTTPNAALAGGRLGLDLVGSIAHTRITLAGTLPGATRIDGADLRITLAGRNLQEPGALFGVILPASRPYSLAADFTKRGRELHFDRLSGRIGDSDIDGTLVGTRAATAQDRFRLAGTLHSRVLDIKDVGPLVGYDPARIDAGKGVVRQVGGRPRLLPDAPLATETLGKFDAHIDYSANLLRTGKLPFNNLRLGLGLDDRLLTLKPLAFDVASGRLTGDISINARQLPVVTDYDLRLSRVPLGKLLTGFKVDDAGTTAAVRGRVQLRGTGDTVRKSLATANGRIALVFPSGTLWLRNIDLAELDVQNFITGFIGKRLKEPRKINCGLIAFNVANGRAVADPIVFDTGKSVFRGAGGFNFADESIALSIEGDSKQFSLFSGQAPIGIHGWFAQPRINVISGKLLARAGAAVALGLVATPFAAIATFVDFGDAKDQDCTPILAARRDTAKSRAADARPKA
jgi:uncharacterized protein involved in outer membrane biogenesis